jgi:signal-transduction protein with cAMP-binding, CBS, and nucleotidyltransferase domain
VEEAFPFMWGIRLRHQVDRALRKESPDDRVDPRALSAVSRRTLREAFRVVEQAQRLPSLDLPLVR